MSILYDEAQTQIATEARRQLEAQFTPERLKQLLETTGEYDTTFWQTACEQGWTAIGIPEEWGGIGMGLVELGLVAEACGAVACGAPFLNTGYGVAQAILEYGSDELKDAWLGKLAAGEVIGAVAFAEGRDFIPAAPAVRFAGGKLSGTKPAVPAGARADLAVVLASGESGPVLVLVELGGEGVRRETLTTFDNSRLAANLGFDGAPAIVLAGAADARAAALEIMRRQAVVTAHEQVGGAEAMLKLERDYAVTRRAFGQVIGAFQSVKHRIAEDYVLVEMARANAINAAAAAGTPEFARAAAAARITGTDAYDTVSRDATQVHGGIGVTWEANLHLHQRRARSLAIEQGNQMFWEDRLVEARTAAKSAATSESSGDAGLDAYRAKARAWLESQVPEFGAAAQKGLSEQEALALGRRWMTRRYEAGYVGIAWPKEHGGQGLGHLEKLAYDQEEMKHGFPGNFFSVSLGMPVPIMLRYVKNEWAVERAIKAMRGEEIWCQLFSEPAGGSDLAGLRTRAVRDEATGDWIMNGQKLWNTWAQHSDYGVIVVRTDPTVAKHKGLTYFWIDMKSPGITVRPVKLASGDSHVNEVFLDDVRVPDSQRMGPVGGGFGVAMETLMIERYQATDPAGFGPSLQLLIDEVLQGTLNGKPVLEDARVRERIARTDAVQNAMASVARRALLSLQAGLEPGPEGALHKLVAVRARQKLSEFAIDLQGVSGVEHPDIHVGPKATWQQSWLTAPTGRIAGGADEMLLNTIAERILGLPQDHRPDKGVAFNDIPK